MKRSRDGPALATHHCVPGSIPEPGAICGLSLLALYSSPRGFSPGTPIFTSPQKPTFPNSSSILERTGISELRSCELLGAPWVNKLRTYHDTITARLVLQKLVLLEKTFALSIVSFTSPKRKIFQDYACFWILTKLSLTRLNGL